MRLSVPVVFLVLANLLPLVGVLWWHWSVFAVMLLFWLENIMIGLLNIPRILFALGDTDERQHRLSSRLSISAFFAMHYGLFTFGHGVFVFSLFGGEFDTDPTLQLTLKLVMEYQLLWPVLALFVSHLVSLMINYFYKGEFRTAKVKQMMKKPYGRVLVLHLGIIFGGFLLQKLDDPLPGLIVLIVIKIIFDLRAHSREHQQLSATMPPASEQV